MLSFKASIQTCTEVSMVITKMYHEEVSIVWNRHPYNFENLRDQVNRYKMRKCTLEDDSELHIYEWEFTSVIVYCDDQCNVECTNMWQRVTQKSLQV